MKKFAKIVLLSSLLVLMLSGIIAYAETNETIFEINVQEPIVITAKWEVGDIDFKLKSPTGVVISYEDVPENYLVTKEENALNFIIFEPEQGDWTAIYDKGINESIQILVDPYIVYYETMYITDFTISKVYDEKYMDVEFYVDNQGDQEYFDYELSVALEGEPEIGKVIKTGWVSSDKIETVKVNLSDVNSYDNYVLVLKITYEKDGVEIFDQEVSEVFSYTNISNQEIVNDFEVIINEAGLGQVIIEPVDSYYIDGYIVNIYEDKITIPSDTKILEDDETLTTFVFDSKTPRLKIEVMSEINGIFSSPKIKEIDLVNMVSENVLFIWPENDLTNQKEYLLPYENGLDKNVKILLNGSENTFKLDDNGNIKLLLEDGYNDVIIDILKANSVTFRINKTIFCDDYPPQLFIYEDVNELYTSNDTITLLGNVEQSATLTCNGEAVEVDADGEYKHEFTLDNGNNEIELVAIDPAGNTTKYTATIKKKKIANDNKQGMLPLFIGLGVAAVLIVVYLVNGIKKAKGINND